MRALLLSLILVAILAGCASKPPGTLPLGGIDVPRMQAQPTIDELIGESEWASAATLRGEFVIRDGTAASGMFPFTLHIGATSDALHLAVSLPNAGRNPWATQTGTYADMMGIFLARTNGTTPERPTRWIDMEQTENAGTHLQVGYWNGRDWILSDRTDGGDFNDGRPDSGTWARAFHDGPMLAWEAYIPYKANLHRDYLQLESGQAYYLALVFSRSGPLEDGTAHSPDARGLFRFPHDSYPGDGYTPHGVHDARAWLAIRLPA